MTTLTIILIAVAVLALLAVLYFAVLSPSRKAKKRLAAEREQAAGHHREVASERQSQASVAEQRAEEAKLEASRAEQQAQLAREEASVHEGRADLHEQGLADHELETGSSDEDAAPIDRSHPDDRQPPVDPSTNGAGGLTPGDERQATPPPQRG